MAAALRRRRAAAAISALYALFLFSTNPLVTVFEDEASITAAARRSVRQLAEPFFSGRGGFHHPPLSDVLLHVWLRLTHESPALLRVPSILFYCLAVWILSETAELLYRKRAIALGAALLWPAGYYLGRPAGWYSLAMLEISGMMWCYCLWRARSRRCYLAGFAGWSALLVYTNHFWWAFIAVFALDLWLYPAGRKARKQFYAASAAVLLVFVPLLPEFLHQARSELHEPMHAKGMALKAVYLTHSLLAGEMAAPWTWPGALAAVCAAGLLRFAWADQESRRALLWLAFPLAIGLASGILSGVRLVLFAPSLVLFLSALAGPGRPKAPAALIAVIFAMGWLGVVTGRYAGTHRYVEPWPEVSARVIELSQPGDVILCNHPSFYFYSSYRLPWPAERSVPPTPVTAQGRIFSPLHAWRSAVTGHGKRLIYVRTTLMPWALPDEKDFLGYASQNRKLLQSFQFDRDLSAPLKRRWFPNVSQPDWRIVLEIWTTPE
jgi:hypothetical protein